MGQKTVNPFPNHIIYKFVDAAGLFWNGKLDENCAFVSEIGVELRSIKTANEIFRSYEITRLDYPGRALPVIEMSTFEVKFVERERTPFSASERDMRMTRVNMVHGRDSRMAAFVRQLYDRKDFTDFAFIVSRNPKSATDLVALVDSLSEPIVSSKKTNKKFIAIRSEADLLYLRMLLGENFLEAFDLATGNRMFEKFDGASS